MLGPLGKYGIAKSLVQTPGWKPLEAEQGGMMPQGGRGGGGFGMSFGGQQGYNDMEKTILAHDEPGGFKVATDQYAAKYSDQLDAWALAEMKQKFPQGPKNGGTWEQEFARQKWFKENAKGRLWDQHGFTGRMADDPRPVTTPIKLTVPGYTGGQLSGVADRDRSGLVKKQAPATVWSSAKDNARRGGSSTAAAQRAASIARQNKAAIASRPRASFSRTGGRTSTSAAAYRNMGRFR